MLPNNQIPLQYIDGILQRQASYLLESGPGCYDVVMKPKVPADQNHPAVIIEFKVFEAKKEKILEETADRALRQIQDKKYDTELIREGIGREYILH